MDQWEVSTEKPIVDEWSVAQETEPKSMGWGEAAYSAIGNIPKSAKQFATDIVQPFIHPVETAQNIKNLGLGVLQKIGAASGDENVKYADAVGQFLVDRSGGIEAVKKTLASDPVGLAADLSLLLTGGGGLAARAPGVAGKIGEAAKIAGRAVDPLTAAGAALKGAGVAGAEILGGLGAHTGGAPIRIAAKAGAEGGAAADAFLRNLRGIAPAEETVEAARRGLGQIVKERGDAYRAQMSKLGLDKTILDFDKIDDAIVKATDVNRYKGIDLSPSTSQIRSDMVRAVQEWRGLDPAQFHTAEGLDALKRKLGNMLESTAHGTPERKVAGDIYKSVRQTIVDQAPKYKNIMEAYEDASDIIKQMEKTLSLNPKASIDTSVRKLQSVLRNNVNAAYGHRKELAKFLVESGAPHLMERLAGQALQPFLPRGLGRLGAEIGMFMHPSIQSAAGLGIGSPRLLGESAYYAGKASKYAKPVAATAFQSGRASGLSPLDDLVSGR